MKTGPQNLKNHNFLIYTLLFFLLFSLSACTSRHMDQETREILNSWKIADSKQTERCAAIYRTGLEERFWTDSSAEKSESKKEFLGRLAALRDYAKRRENPRVEARNALYEAYGKMLYNFDNKEYINNLLDAAGKKAAELNDQQLLSEVFKLKADVSEDENTALYYNALALDFLSEFGTEDIFFSQEELSNVSRKFYNIGDYNNAIKYGDLFVNKWYKSDSRDSLILILQKDILGASYRELNQYDSCAQCYQFIAENAEQFLKNREPEFRIPMWQALSKGRIGAIQAKWKMWDEALSNLQEYKDVSLHFKDTANIITALTDLGDYYIQKEDVKCTLSNLRLARVYATASYPALQKNLLKRLSEAYELAEQEDSARVNNEKYQQIDEQLVADGEKLEHARIKTELDNQQIQNILNTVRHQKSSKKSNTKNVIWSVVLIAIIIYILYRFLIMRRVSKNHVTEFKSAVKEKSELIEKMYDSIDVKKENKAVSIADHNIATEKQWVKFRTTFTKAYPNFFPNLERALGRTPTIAYQKLAALLYLNLNNQEIAKALGISKESVGRSKRRLRASLNLDQDLQGFISTL